MKVAAILDSHTLAITCDGHRGIRKGDIIGVGGSIITDPDTGDLLGRIEGIRLKVSQVHARFIVAETYKVLPAESLDNMMKSIANAKPAREVAVSIGDPAWKIS